MIYFKKRSLIKKAVNNFKRNIQNGNIPFLSLFKVLFILFFLILFVSYISYFYLMPRYVNEKSFEKIINASLLKNTDLMLDIADFRVKSDYKFDINLKASSVKLKYPNNKDFLVLENPDIDIAIIPLFFGYIDLNKLKAQKIKIFSEFNKDNQYTFNDSFKFCLSNKRQKIKLRNIKLNADEFLFQLFDENINEKFYIKASQLKIYNNDYRKNINISTIGQISGEKYKISDFDLKLEIKPNENSVNKFRDKFLNLNYNPMRYAYIYKFYSNSKIDLKIAFLDKKANLAGNIFLNDYTFNVNNIQMPKNNLVLNFKGEKIYTDCNFKFIKNQIIQIKSEINLAKNKFIETKLSSNQINLSDLGEILSVLEKIFNLKLNLDSITLFGYANADIYIKSDFKTIASKGSLSIKDAKLEHKKTGLKLKDINSNVNFNDNFINILNTSAFIDKAKFDLSGTIDKNTNLNLKIVSDEINIAQIIKIVDDLPFGEVILPILKKCSFENGLLKIDTQIAGTFNKPVVKSNSVLKNLKINLKQQNSNLEIPILTLKFLQNDVLIPKTKIFYDGIDANVNGKMKNYLSKQSELVLNIESKLDKFKFLINDKKPSLNCSISFKNNNLYFNTCDISKAVYVNGKITEFSDSKNLNEIKFSANDKTKIKLLDDNISFLFKGNSSLIMKDGKNDVFAKMNLYQIEKNDIALNIPEANLEIKNSLLYFDTPRGFIGDLEFDINSQFNIYKDKIVFDFVNIQMPYMKLMKIKEKLASAKNASKFKFEFNNIKGNVSTVELGDIVLNSFIIDAQYKNNELKIDNFSAYMLNGKIGGNFLIDLVGKKTNAKIKLSEINIRLLPSGLKEFFIATSGKLNALIDVSFIGTKKEQIINTMISDIEFNINNGELSQFAKLERFLQAGNILSQNFLKLNLNSILSAITKQNTGDFKIIEGKIKIKDMIANIEKITSQGSNMSLYIQGDFNILNQRINAYILGRIPNTMVNAMGSLGNFSLSQKVDKMDNEVREVINSITASPFEKKFTIEFLDGEIDKIPKLAYQLENSQTREFFVLVDGIINNVNSIRNFKWIKSYK